MVGNQIIAIVPVEGGWSLQCSMIGQHLFFLSSAKAEEHARRLGAVIAQLGQDVRVMIHARDHALLGTRSYFAP